MIARSLIVLIASAATLWPCSCGRGASAPACEVFHEAQAVFLGTVVDKYEYRGYYMPWVAYLVKVDEAFLGLEPSQTEIIIDPDNSSMCGRTYDVGGQYLFFAFGLKSSPRRTLAAILPENAELPFEWKTKMSHKVYPAGMCNPTKEVARAADDLAWLRARKHRNPMPTRVFGYTLQNSDQDIWPLRDRLNPLSAAQVTLQGATQQFTMIAGDDGSYSIEGVPPGNYQVVAERPNWSPSARDSFTLAPGGCVERDLSLGSHASVQGTVLDRDGRPVSGVDVELVRVLPKGSLAGKHTASAETDGEGRFHLRDVAASTFVVGVNVTNAPTADQPYLAAFAPGVAIPDDARQLVLEPTSDIRDVVLRLPAPLPTRSIWVRVRWADGTPVEADTWVRAQHRGSHAGDGELVGGGFRLKLLQGLDYTIFAYSSHKSVYGLIESEKVKLPAGDSTVTIDLRLKVRKP